MLTVTGIQPYTRLPLVPRDLLTVHLSIHHQCVCRDYLHVVDLALGHLAALKWLASSEAGKAGVYEVVNLGTGNAVSVLEMVRAFEKACGKPLAYELGPRRPGDAPRVWADATKAKELLGWTASFSDVDTMCRDSWNWVSKNPNGFNKQ